MPTKKSPVSPKRFYYFNSTHWDREWYQPFQKYRHYLVQNAAGILDALEHTKDFQKFVYDGQRIYVPKAGEAMPYPDGNNAYDGLGRLDLNAATAEMLKELPGIGEKRASDIIGYREKNGRFTSVEQLQEIPGLKGSVYQGMKDLVCVR